MTRLTGPTLVVLVVLVVVAAAQEEKAATLEVFYPQRTIPAARGSSVKLSCDAVYLVEKCGPLRAAWYQRDVELTDPRKYLTTVNETVNEADGGLRRRQVVTEILDLTPKDDGQFQCRAQCQTGGQSMGHYIYISVRADAPLAEGSR